MVVVLSIEEGPGAPDDPRAMAQAAGLHDDDDPDRRAANLQACAGAALRRSALRGGDPYTHCDPFWMNWRSEPKLNPWRQLTSTDA